MDTDYSSSDLSRLTTMLTEVHCPFVRIVGANATRFIEVGNVTFGFDAEGKIVSVEVAR